MTKHTVKENNVLIFIVLTLFIFFFSIYLLTASENNFYYNDTSVLRFQVSESIVERSDLSVPEGLRGVDGKYYSWMGIGSALIAVPFYIIGKFMGGPVSAVSIMNQIFGAATIVLIFLFCISLGYSRRASILVAFFYGLGTMAWPLAKQPFDHTIETFFILFSVYFMYLYGSNKKVSHLLFSSIALGFAFITRPTSILAVPPLFILMIISLSKQSGFKTTLKLMIKNIFLFSLALLPFISLFFWYNYYCFGSIFETGYHLMAARLGISLFKGTSFLEGLSGFLISPGKGYFFYSPIAILFFFSIKLFMKRHRGLAISFIAIMLSYLIFLSKYVYWHGDFAWGPRYIFVLTPFFIIPVAELFEPIMCKKRKIWKVVVYSIFSLSLLIQIAAVSVDFQKYFTNLKVEGKITVIKGERVMPILVPLDETYFKWYKSPLLAQFQYIYEIAKNMKYYEYSEPTKNATDFERISADHNMNIFDFWWLYNYYEDRSYSGFIAAVILVIVAIYTFIKLCRLSYYELS